MTDTHDLDRRFMQLALDACRQGVFKGQSPFGAAIVRDGRVLAVSHNHVLVNLDATAHAEIEAIRRACHEMGDVHLPGTTIYSTTEPCPMCFTAIHWARIERIVYAARVDDARDFGFNELRISNATMKQASGSTIELVPDFMREQAIEIYELWRQRQGRTY